MAARFRLAELELGSTPDDFAAELDEAVDELEQREHLRTAADDGQHDDAEAALQLRVLVQVVEDDVADLATLEIDDDSHPIAIGLVADVGNAFDRLVAHLIGDLLDQSPFIDLVGNGGDDD